MTIWGSHKIQRHALGMSITLADWSKLAWTALPSSPMNL